MTGDLEETLNELGPGYREVVDRLMSASRPWEGAVAAARLERPASGVALARGRQAGYLAAALLLAVLGLAALFCAPRARGTRSAARAPVYTVRATTAENEYRLALIRDDAAVREMIRTQNPDGSWKNDFLTRRNAEALKDCRGPEAQLAYKKAIRNLRARGLL